MSVASDTNAIHYAGRLKVNTRAVLVGQDAMEVAACGNPCVSPKACDANARRLAAAWNCLNGIPTDTLEAIAGEREPAQRLLRLAEAVSGEFMSVMRDRRAQAAAMVPVNAGEDDPDTNDRHL